MDISVQLGDNISLRIANSSRTEESFPTRRLKKGFILVYDDQELVEEGVGFGVPVLNLRHRSIFTGGLELSVMHKGDNRIILARYLMNLEERISTPETGEIDNKRLHKIKNYLAWLIRTYPKLRVLLTAASNYLRFVFNWQTTYELVGGYGEIRAEYAVDRASGRLDMVFNTTGLMREAVTEVIVMNEQGANYFNRYQDSDGHDLREDEIGCWDRVTADRAAFICDHYRLAFHLGQVGGARLFRGRELVDTRLAWSGFGYSFTPQVEYFHCTLRLERQI